MKFTDAPATFYRTRARRASRRSQELIVNNFAGGGGACLGIELATGRAVDICVNHDPDAVKMHEVNHPASRHLCESVWKVDPVEAVGGRPVGLAWFSPDCRHFSRAKGGKPVKKNVRGLAWVVVKWAKLVKPRVIILENVREFQDWGPLTVDFMPCLKRKGDTFRRWWRSLERLGYVVEKKILDAADYGAPTHRKRLFVVARCDGAAIVWPEKTHGPLGTTGGKVRCVRSSKRPRPERMVGTDTDLRGGGGSDRRTHCPTLRPFRTAAECIDWSIPCPSIFDRKRPLAEKTLRRIAMGLKRYVLEAASPFIVKINHGKDEFRGQGLDRPLTTVTGSHGHAIVTPYVVGVGGRMGQSPERSVERPFQTITSKADSVVVSPYLVEVQNGSGINGTRAVDRPAHTITANPKGGGMALVAPTLIQTGFGERDGQAPRALDLHKPLGTVCGTQKHALIAALLTKHYGGDRGQCAGRSLPMNGPIGTVTTSDHHALTTAHLTCFHGGTGPQWSDANDPIGTITSQGNKFGLVYAFLMKFFGSGGQWQTLADPLHTITGRDRFGLVTVEVDPGHQEPAVWVDVPGIGPCLIADIGMRMLSPRELLAAQFGPELAAEYVLTGSKANRVHKIGNSVCPAVARALVEANFERAGAEVAS